MRQCGTIEMMTLPTSPSCSARVSLVGYLTTILTRLDAMCDQSGNWVLWELFYDVHYDPNVVYQHAVDVTSNVRCASKDGHQVDEFRQGIGYIKV